MFVLFKQHSIVFNEIYKQICQYDMKKTEFDTFVNKFTKNKHDHVILYHDCITEPYNGKYRVDLFKYYIPDKYIEKI